VTTALIFAAALASLFGAYLVALDLMMANAFIVTISFVRHGVDVAPKRDEIAELVFSWSISVMLFISYWVLEILKHQEATTNEISKMVDVLERLAQTLHH